MSAAAKKYRCRTYTPLAGRRKNDGGGLKDLDLSREKLSLQVLYPLAEAIIRKADEAEGSQSPNPPPRPFAKWWGVPHCPTTACQSAQWKPVQPDDVPG